ncbi:MAG TPA: nitrilase-related carbon-nitrogen hydrolase, partial [Anaeromyxobacteraceae bacterium]|nr:nitrilase-related carbon-nitrogen hydrolase [Anaeromyxobacteraceae bacterium]
MDTPRTGRIALAQVNPTVGAFEDNAAKIRLAAARARAAGARLVVYPELVVCGYPPRDLLDLPEFLERARRTLEALARPADWSRGLALVIGFPERAEGAPPPGVYNAVALVEDGRIVAVGRKSLLPTYDVFDEARHFLPAPRPTAAASVAGGATLGLSVCEDIWNDKRFWDRPRYARDPIAELVGAGADLVVNVSASPYAMGKPALRERMLAAAACEHGRAIAYVNQVGGNDALVFDGGSVLLDARGEVVARAPLFDEAVVVADLDGGAVTATTLDGAPVAPSPAPAGAQAPEAVADEVFRALVVGTRDYVRKCGFRSVVIGLSGGIDSALTACIAAEAVGKENVLGVAMPSRYSSSHSVEDATALAENLGIR